MSRKDKACAVCKIETSKDKIFSMSLAPSFHMKTNDSFGQRPPLSRRVLFPWAAGLTFAWLLLLNSDSALAQNTVIAYAVPANIAGNQNVGGASLGLDFDVDNEILVTRLGVFDENSDGLQLAITARLFDRAQLTELVSIEFSPESPGELIGGSRFKPLPAPLRLAAGFQGTISADGYAAEERIFNSHGNTAVITWTLNDGAASIRFVGTSRYGTGGEFPATADAGPAARFVAGTFEYQTTPPVLPGKPNVSAQAADKQIVLSWPPVTVPAAAAKYRVSRGNSSAGPFTQLGELTDLTYTDTGLVNGTVYCYVVEGITADGKVGSGSTLCASPYVLAANHYIAYFTPGGTAGSQAFGGSLGLDFDVQNPVIVTRLGVFDEFSDGLKLPLTARIFNRDTEEMVVELNFTPDDPGDLIAGMRFKALTPPLRLEAGFHGVMQADGYGAEEKELNSFGDPSAAISTLNSGNGSILFVGGGRYSASPAIFPATVDGGPPARYAAGTFEFQALPPEVVGTAHVAVTLPFEDGVVTLTWLAVTQPLPAAKYEVQRGTAAGGPFTKIAETTELSYRDTTVQNGTEYFYVVRALATGGQASTSAPVSAKPNPIRGGVAYIVPAGTPGNQNLANGAVGMDFDVAYPIKVTKLGVFDDSSDGLLMTLTAVLYDRAARKALATLEFTTDSQGELIDGSRFKTLTEPLILDEGFQGSMVIWYSNGSEERLFNTFGSPDPAVVNLQVFDGGSLLFVGASRYGSAGSFPTTVDSGPANRYAGGTFAFEPTVIVRPTFIAYSVPANTVGNQDLTGASLGMDFDVANEIILTRLGVFDENSDGLKQTITAKLWDRNSLATPVASIDFTAQDPGELIAGNRFKPLTKPMRLPRGFQGTITTDGYGSLEKIKNSHGEASAVTWTLNGGNGSVVFVGSGRYGAAGQYPATPDGGPPARYAAGTFEYQTTPAALPGQPLVSVHRPFEEGAVTLNWLAVTEPLPAAKYEVSRAGTKDGPFAKIAETTGLAHRDTSVQNGTQYFYVVRAVGAGGQIGDNSLPVPATPNPRQAGIAYIVPAGLAANQGLANGSVGMDFDVVFPIKVTKLGVFDDSSDGLKMTLTAVLYDRVARQPLATLEFTTANQGELVNGSRLLTLTQPLALDAGFQGSIVIWYSDGTDERLFNTFGGSAEGANLQLFDGGSILFVGGGRFGSSGQFPGTADGGPVNRYAGATFAFEPGAVVEQIVIQAARSGANLKLTWNGGGVLERTEALGGSWQAVAGAASGVELPLTGTAGFFRVRR